MFKKKEKKIKTRDALQQTTNGRLLFVVVRTSRWRLPVGVGSLHQFLLVEFKDLFVSLGHWCQYPIVQGSKYIKWTLFQLSKKLLQYNIGRNLIHLNWCCVNFFAYDHRSESRKTSCKTCDFLKNTYFAWFKT